MDATNYPDSEAIKIAIERFRNFLNSTWPALTEILKEHDWDDDAYFLEDWLDENWNLLVGRQLLGQGNILQPFAVATNEINKGNYSYRLESKGDRKLFVSLGSGEGTFKIAPPFDKIKVVSQSGVSEVVPWASLQFELKKIP